MTSPAVAPARAARWASVHPDGDATRRQREAAGCPSRSAVALAAAATALLRAVVGGPIGPMSAAAVASDLRPERWDAIHPPGWGLRTAHPTNQSKQQPPTKGTDCSVRNLDGRTHCALPGPQIAPRVGAAIPRTTPDRARGSVRACPDCGQQPTGSCCHHRYVRQGLWPGRFRKAPSRCWCEALTSLSLNSTMGYCLSRS
uniref:Uncharacterized protein n=1 Tax=Mycobacterium kansasii TaxID=1768 RepID=A0A653EFT2_MYCKA|nr:hypothetical protein BIN_B_00274 [Mycobacterium kansasii]